MPGLILADAVSIEDFSSVFAALTEQISVTTVVGVIAGVVALTVGLAFMWWGVRYGTAKLMAAFKKGRA